MLLAPKLAGGYTTFFPRNVKKAENREANLQRCGDRNRLLLATAMSQRSSRGPPPVSALRFLRRRGGGMVIFRKLGEKAVFRVGRVRSYRSNRQDSVLLGRGGIMLCRKSRRTAQVMMCSGCRWGEMSLPEHDCASCRYWEP